MSYRTFSCEQGKRNIIRISLCINKEDPCPEVVHTKTDFSWLGSVYIRLSMTTRPHEGEVVTILDRSHRHKDEPLSRPTVIRPS